MNRHEFLDILRQSLAGEVKADVINDNLNYYNEYIMTEMRKGREESEVLKSLGDPRLLAKTIIDANCTQDNGAYTTYSYEENNSEDIYENNQKRVFRLPGWVMLILIFVAACVVVGVIGSVVASLLPVIIPVAVILYVIYRFRK